MQIQSNLKTLKELTETDQYFFNIPIYQRLYVWETGQIKTLLEDIETAFNDKKELFYLGGVLVVDNGNLSNGNGKLYDLIDGQQRFTTLWMIAIVLQEHLTPFIQRLEKDKKRHRVSFAIRDDIFHFFKNVIENDIANGGTKEIQNALALIKAFKEKWNKKSPTEIQEISDFIYKKVKLVWTEVPKETDLNKLFEIINNRGVQLQHHEILKAQLLNKIEPDDRLKYSYLWDACSYMSSYLEKNIRDITKVKVQNLFENNQYDSNEEALANSTKVLAALTDTSSDAIEPLSLVDILSNDNSTAKSNSQNNDSKEAYQANKIRSIINFPMLLQHTLRIYLVRKQEADIPKILDKELLQLFSKHFLVADRTKDDIKEFIELLWNTRYLFDKHIIKWVEKNEGEEHLISKINKVKVQKNKKINYYLRRTQPQSNEGVALLQSMLYHSQQLTTHYWLTPYLNYLLNNNGQNNYDYLKRLDNYLLCSNETAPLIERTRKFLDNENHQTTFDLNILSKPEGVAFPHYWFYKLEYILWVKYKDTEGDKWKNYKMTAKNSVEHISPQKQQITDTNKVSSSMLDCFGNLALVTGSINSTYGALPFNEKRQRFINRKNTGRLDALKMHLMYKSDTWNDDEALNHQKDMIEIINEYLNPTS
jgi:hypothetical protein